MCVCQLRMLSILLPSWAGVCEGGEPDDIPGTAGPAHLKRHQHNIGDTSEETWQAEGVVDATGVMNPQDRVKTHLGTNAIVSRSAGKTHLPTPSLHNHSVSTDVNLMGLLPSCPQPTRGSA